MNIIFHLTSLIPLKIVKHVIKFLSEGCRSIKVWEIKSKTLLQTFTGQTSQTREGVQRRHDPRKNDLRASRFAEGPPGPAKPYPRLPPFCLHAPHFCLHLLFLFFLFNFIDLTKKISKYISSQLTQSQFKESSDQQI